MVMLPTLIPGFIPVRVSPAYISGDIDSSPRFRLLFRRDPPEVAPSLQMLQNGTKEGYRLHKFSG